MPLFEITWSDGTRSVMQAHNKTLLREALANVIIKKIVEKPRCKQCKMAIATVQGTFCKVCWEAIIVPTFRKAFKNDEDTPMNETEFENLVISFWVNG